MRKVVNKVQLGAGKKVKYVILSFEKKYKMTPVVKYFHVYRLTFSYELNIKEHFTNCK